MSTNASASAIAASIAATTFTKPAITAAATSSFKSVLQQIQGISWPSFLTRFTANNTTSDNTGTDKGTKRARDEIDAETEEQKAKRIRDSEAIGKTFADNMRARDIATFKAKLKKAVKANDLDRIERLIRNELFAISDITISNHDKTLAIPLLHYATVKRCGNSVAKLIEMGTDVNVVDERNGWTALMIAARHGNEEICHSLLQANANVNLKARDGKAAIKFAVDARKIAIVRMLITVGNADVNIRTSANSLTLLENAVASGNIELVNLLIDAGANINGALHAAVEKGNRGMVHYMINKNRAAGNTVDFIPPCRENTALVSALLLGQDDMALILLQNGADPDQKIPKRLFPDLAEASTPLHFLAVDGMEPERSITFTKAFISANARVGATNKAGETPLLLAARNNKLRIAKILVNNGRADIEAELSKAIVNGESRECKQFLAKLMLYKFDRAMAPIAQTVPVRVSLPLADEVADTADAQVDAMEAVPCNE